jgi:hypothetical protein
MGDGRRYRCRAGRWPGTGGLGYVLPIGVMSPEEADVAEASSGRSRTRRWLVPLAAMAAVVVVIGGVALAAGRVPSGAARAAGPRPGPARGLPSGHAADPPAFAGNVQSRAGTRQWIKLFSPVTGRIVHQVAAFGDTLTGNGMALSPDSRFIYATLSRPGPISIHRISVATGRRAFIADGAQPAISPDGRYLAYATGRHFNSLAIRDLRAGTTRTVDLARVIGADSELLNGQITWLGSGAQIVVMPAGFSFTSSRVQPSSRNRSSRAAARASCDQQRAPNRLCLVLVSLTGRLPQATRIFVPGSWSMPLISGDANVSHTLLLAGTSAGQQRIGVATVSAARVTMRLMIGMPPRSLPLAFAPAGDRILYLQSRGPPSLWIATISDRGLADIRRLFTDNSHFAIDGATW